MLKVPPETCYPKLPEASSVIRTRALPSLVPTENRREWESVETC